MKLKKALGNIFLAEDWTSGKQIASALILFLAFSSIFILYKTKGIFIAMLVSLIK